MRTFPYVTDPDYGDRLLFEMYERLPVKIVELDVRSKAAVITPVRDRLIGLMQRRQIDVLIIDPFVASHAANENDNNQIEQVASAWRDVAEGGELCSKPCPPYPRAIAGVE